MERNSFGTQTANFFTKWNLYLVLICLAINIILSTMVSMFHLPIFLDTMGTILAGGLGGFVPGMTVGFLTNAITSLSNPMMLFYGVLSILIGALSAIFSEKGYFKSWKGWLLVSFCYVIVAGFIGVTITWNLYEGSVGGTSDVLGRFFQTKGLSPYFSQLAADLLIEIPDKLFMVGAVCIIIKKLPKKVVTRLPLGGFYDDLEDADKPRKFKKSISKKVTYILILSVFLSCILSISVFLVYYMQRVKKSSEDFATAISKQAAGYVDGDKINQYLDEGDSNSNYKETEDNLNVLYKNSAQIEYLFVYAIREDGVHVVFDIDTPDLKGDNPGTILEPEQGVSSDYKKYMHGEKIPIEYSNGEYGNVLTVYSRVFNSDGDVVAYAGVDIDMSGYYRQYFTVAIQVISIIFAMVLFMFTIILWYIQKYITKPIQIIVQQTEELENISPEKWIDSEEWKHQIVLDTQDELAQLNQIVSQVEEKASRSMKRVIESEHANQAKTDFLSRMSHDMRTPLNGILNFSDFILDVNSLDEAKEYATKILASGRYLETLINDTLGMSRIESGKVVLKPEPYSYGEFESSIRNVLEEKAASKGVELRFIHSEDMSNVLELDPLRIQQICINILNNAIKFTPRGGLVILKTERVDCTKEQETLRISITDTGIGMSKKFIQEELFRPFAQERQGRDNEETGTGLGLSIAKQLVEIMNGEITCESEEGEGTTFRIVLTAKIAKEAKKREKHKTLDLSRLKGLRILLCEDHILNREIAIKLLSKEGCMVDAVENGKKGINVFQNYHEVYDLILMDIRMPVMDGIEATKAIREMKFAKAKDIPIIAMTANAYEGDVEECLRAGMNAHISKPIQPQHMYQIILENLKS